MKLPAGQERPAYWPGVDGPAGGRGSSAERARRRRARAFPWIRAEAVAGSNAEPSQATTSVRMVGGKTNVLDGPYADTKEQLAGFYILNCRDLDEAIEMAGKVPDAISGSIEIRPVIEF